MKFVKGPIPEDIGFEPLDEGWSQMKEPDLKRVKILALPCIPLLVLIIFMLATFLGFNFNVGIINIFISLIIVIPIHEVVHALAFPDSLTSHKVILGYYPKGNVFFAHYDGEMTRNRFILTLVSLFLVISVLPLIIGAVVNFKSPLILSLSFVNAVLTYIDIFGAILIFSQIPAGAIMKNKGEKSYWKLRRE